ncbi:hypothetical protein P280DRAFT_481387 [Massarina eburnea CBS 473.64]|uniref:SnoaL-like domain-containing protein n=1 Tax=Massarina eburnea CBS 473.64 TaxID=1395130 RepID=A0A6A6RYD5_9PLEO|nr:hypothetical protein P280DRAFT_481387 [Massarina eburnea CBS 473.64]
MATQESARVRTANEFLHVFTTLDTTPLQTILAPNYHHTFGPNSLTGFGPYDKPGFIKHVSGLFQFLTTFPVIPVETIDSESSNAVWVWTKTDAQFKEEVRNGEKVEDWVYKGENMFMFWFDGEGRISRCVELVDSKKTVDELLPLMGRARANLLRGEGGE